MKRIAFVLAFISSIPAFASEGGGVRNGGSGYRCGSDAPQIAEYPLARRFSIPYQIEDRYAFMETVLNKISNHEYAFMLLQQWLRYGDSEAWPDGTLDDVKVYYYESPTRIHPYSKEGAIPPTNPGAEICSAPLYSPAECCERVLLSYFGEQSLKPTRILKHYRQLDRIQKNILELHEAVYRTAFQLATMPAPSIPDFVQREIDAYRAIPGTKDVLPAIQIVHLVSNLISPKMGAEDIKYAIDYYWAWTSVLDRFGGSAL